MKELIDKAEVVAEIKSLMCTTFTNFDEGVNAAAKSLLESIDTLEVKEVDLEKEIDNIWNPRFNLGWDEKSLLSINHSGFTTIAKYFFELGLKTYPEWFEARARKSDVEYIRTDVFINKACEWLKKSTILADTTIKRYKKAMGEQL